jgi:hypothetical protein
MCLSCFCKCRGILCRALVLSLPCCLCSCAVVRCAAEMSTLSWRIGPTHNIGCVQSCRIEFWNPQLHGLSSHSALHASCCYWHTPKLQLDAARTSADADDLTFTAAAAACLLCRASPHWGSGGAANGCRIPPTGDCCSRPCGLRRRDAAAAAGCWWLGTRSTTIPR